MAELPLGPLLLVGSLLLAIFAGAVLLGPRRRARNRLHSLHASERDWVYRRQDWERYEHAAQARAAKLTALGFVVTLLSFLSGIPGALLSVGMLGDQGDGSAKGASTDATNATESPRRSESTGTDRQDDRDLRGKVGKLIMVGFRGASLDVGAPVLRQIARSEVGAVVLYDKDVMTKGHRNILSVHQVKALTATLQRAGNGSVLIAADEEGGSVSRLKPLYEEMGTPSVPAAKTLGAQGPAATYAEAKRIASTLRDVGINWNLAPVVDVEINARSREIGQLGRSFSSDPAVVVENSVEFIRAHREENVLTALKHFPGLGSASGSTHDGVVDVTGTWSETELQPYKALVAQRMADAVMVGHVFNRRLDGSWPASLSPRVICTLLRTTVGFDGPVLSDDLQMGAIRAEYDLETSVRKALLSGADMLIFGNNVGNAYDEEIAPKVVDIVVRLVEDGGIDESRIDESVGRIEAMKRRIGLRG